MSAARRRSRQQVEDDEEDADSCVPSPLSSQRASRSPQPRAAKRLRTSAGGSRSSDSVVDDEGIDFQDADEDERENSEDEEGIRLAATQRMANEERVRRDRDAGNASKDVLKSIELFNFMCHRRLEINLGDQLNFIIGHNGSGKSAILTALTIALGVKATVTNRGTSLKDFIKHGEQTAVVVVKILNGGSDPFKPDLYGDVIVVERRFSRDGTSSYKLKSKTNHTVSTKKDDLQEILDHYQFQIDNPMTILTQDTARLFLGNSSPGEKYRLFMRGVQLLQLDNDYQMMEGTVSMMGETLESKAEALDDLKENDRRWRNQMQIFERSAAIEDEVRKLQNMYAWVQVKNAEKTLAANEVQVQQAEERIRECNANIQAAIEQLNEYDVKVQDANDKKKEVESQKVQLEGDLKEAKEAVRVVVADLNQLEADRKKLEAGVIDEETLINENKEKIRAEQAKQNDNGERQRKQEESERLTAELQDWQARVYDTNTAISRLENQIKAKDATDKDVRRRKDDVRQQVDQAKRAVDDLLRTKQNNLTCYNKNMPKTVNEIRRRVTEFQDPPIGPLGMHVKLRDAKDEEWVPVLEKLFGRNLNAFLVTNFDDRKKLSAILEQNQCDVPIIVSKRDRFDYSSGEPDPKFKTVLNILDINDEYVKRQLITQNHIESTILITDRREADQVMYRHPKNVFACYALNKERPGTGWRVGGAVGGSGTSPVIGWTRNLRLSSRSIEQQIEDAKRAVSSLQGELDQLEREVVQNTTELRELRKSINAEKRTATEAESSRQRAEAALGDVTEYLNSQDPASGLIVAFEIAINEATERKRVCVDQLRAIDADQREKIEQYKVLEQTKKDKEAANNEHGQKCQEAESNLANIMVERVRLSNGHDHWKKQLAKKEEEFANTQAELRETREKLVIITEGAITFCPERVPDHELKFSLEQIVNKIGAQKKRLEMMARQAGMSEDEAREKYLNAHQQYKDAQGQMDNLKQTYSGLHRSLGDRKRRFALFRQAICLKARELFTHLLSLRGFQGKLVIDHNACQMKIKVDPGSGKGTRKDPKSLSGGEKSFSQVCMLLAVWEAMGSPLRALDEFDVYMDAVNRKMAMRMMIEWARISTGKQFILITPQDMGNVAVGPDIRVHRMRDPERGRQAVLN